MGAGLRDLGGSLQGKSAMSKVSNTCEHLKNIDLTKNYDITILRRRGRRDIIELNPHQESIIYKCVNWISLNMVADQVFLKHFPIYQFILIIILKEL